MPKKIIFTDKEVRIEQVKSAMKETKDKRMYERYQCIFLLLSGEPRNRITTILNRGMDTIGFYIQAYCKDGLEGLELEHSPGRPKFMTAEQEIVLYLTIVDKKPADVGFPANMNWTAVLVRKWIENEFQIRYSERGARQLLYRLGFSYTKPTYTMAKADPEKQEVFKSEFEALKKIATRRN
jgi:transposase